MPLGPYMIHCAVRIIGDKWDEKDRRFCRKPKGTGFVVLVSSESFAESHHSYVVTAHHVIDGQPNPELAIANPQKQGELYPTIPTEGPNWKHPIEELDVAVLPFDRPEGYWITALHMGTHLLEHLPTETMLAAPFHYVGLLERLNRMMVRSGTIGAVDQTGIEHEDGYRYRTHLGDCRSYEGFSGSPCFIEYPVPTLTPHDAPVPLPQEDGPAGRIKYLHLLCGMFTGHLERLLPGDEVSRLGVGFILSSDEIWRALMDGPLVKQRREADEQIADRIVSESEA